MINLPSRAIKIGIFISGGLDSALLYYFLHKANVDANQRHKIVPITVIKNSKTLDYVTSILSYYNCNEDLLTMDGTVIQSVIKSRSLGFDKAFVGTIKELPEFLQGWESSTYSQNKFYRTPLAKFDKRQIVQAIVDNQLTKLFELTHSCANFEIGRCNKCNRCRERKWAFDQLDLVDPGVL